MDSKCLYVGVNVSKKDQYNHLCSLFEFLSEKERVILRDAVKCLLIDYGPDFSNAICQIVRFISSDIMADDLVEDQQLLDLTLGALDPEWVEADKDFFVEEDETEDDFEEGDEFEDETQEIEFDVEDDSFIDD